MSKPKSRHRVFSRAFKLGIVDRMLAGEKVSALARELKLSSSKELYIWRKRFLTGGPGALRGPGRPCKAEAIGLAAVGSGAKAPDTPLAAELAKAQRRIAELERKVGEQHMDLDFFQQALQRVKGARRPSAGPGVTGSTRSSKR
jgi:transposase-like protein